MKLFKRSGLAAIAIAGAALIATGCGGDGGSGATAAAKDAAVLDLVPKNAIGYVTVDTDFSGDNWQQFDDLAAAFDKNFKGVDKEISDAAAEGEDGKDKVDFAKDVDPWLGKSGGAALLSMKAGTKDGDSEGEFFAWVELDDTAKFEDFAKDQDLKQGKKVGDYETFAGTKDDEMHVAYNDDYAIFTDSRAQLEKTVKFDGDSIKDADGVSNAIDEVGDDALATLVVSGDGARKVIAETAGLSSLKDAKQLKDFQSLAVSLAAEDDGMRVSGFVGADGEDAPKNAKRDVFESLPGNTVLALGGSDLGNGLKTIVEEAGKENPQVQQGVGAISAAVGVDLDDLAKAFDGEFALGMAADDAGLGSLAGGVAGAAMGGGLGGVDPAALAKAASITLAFEETGDASETLDKLAGALGSLTGATAAPVESKKGDFTVKQLTVQGFPVTTAASGDIAALSVGADVFSTWGTESLGDNDTYDAAWKAADAPDASAGTMWFDAGRVARLVGVESGEDVELGGLVGWIEGDGSNAKFGMFLHIEEK